MTISENHKLRGSGPSACRVLNYTFCFHIAKHIEPASIKEPSNGMSSVSGRDEQDIRRGIPSLISSDELQVFLSGIIKTCSTLLTSP